MDFNLAARTAVVTGASTGTGLAAVRLLAASGARGNTRPHSHGQPRQPPVPEPDQCAQINPFSALLQTTTDYETWQGASRLRAAEYLL